MAKHKRSKLDKLAREKLNELEVGHGTEAMTRDYKLKKGQIVRKKPKEKMSKKERLRQRWKDGDRFE